MIQDLKATVSLWFTGIAALSVVSCAVTTVADIRHRDPVMKAHFARELEPFYLCVIDALDADKALSGMVMRPVLRSKEGIANITAFAMDRPWFDLEFVQREPRVVEAVFRGSWAPGIARALESTIWSNVAGCSKP